MNETQLKAWLKGGVNRTLEDRPDHELKKKYFATFFDPDEDRARQEFKGSVDVNATLQSMGVPTAQQSGFVDFTVDLQQVYENARTEHEAFMGSPQLRQEFGSFHAFLAAATAARAAFVQEAAKLEVAESEKRKAYAAKFEKWLDDQAAGPPAGSSGGGAGASPSDSAAERAPKGAKGADKAS